MKNYLPPIAPITPELRIADAARLETMRTLERHGRIPDSAEIARAIERTVRRELFEAELAGELKTTRQYCQLLEQLLRDARPAI